MVNKMSTSSINKNNIKKDNNSKIITEIARKDIEKSINLQDSNNTEAYYSNRYGWTLRKTVI
tara:strand:- start:322 stop:507 length:186 start_codon:yes stop_codon:yes gene_type:complete